MDFRLTNEQQALQDEARGFADDVVAPGAQERDRAHEFPRDVVRQAGEKGYLGLLIPEEYGGGSVGNVAQCLILEEIARADASTHVTISVHNSLFTVPVLTWGTEAFKKKYLPRFATGELLGAYALTEPHSGSDAAALSTTAVRDGDEWVLNGTKMWITTGASANFVVVFARTDKDAPNVKGISAFVVDTDQPGFTCGKKENKTGIRASETVQLFLEDVRVPADNLLGEVNRGFNYALETLNGGRIGIATQAVGIAKGALDAAIAHFDGKVAEKGSVFSSQDVDFRFADMATRIEASRLLVWRAAQMRDRNEPHVREASMAKLVASRSSNAVCRDAVALLGPAGQVGACERMLRDARVTEIYEGTTEIQRLVVSRALKAGRG
ncbi:MAG: acyl-CoA dehydrogenase family protein [Planctomycetota bacterium]|nr:acyl-CoA dehydrogenase family protein [Planctomycetota bacterium]